MGQADADPVFLDACYTASGGNPLLVQELVGTVMDEGLAATAENADLVLALGSRALTQRVGLRLAQLPS
jgi:hypothetical protein